MGPRLQERIPHTDGDVEFGARLRECREGLGMSQRDLAFPGCTAAYISRIERGERRPSLQVIVQMANRLEVNAEWLATGDDSHKHNQYIVEAFKDLNIEAVELLKEIKDACGGKVDKLQLVVNYAQRKFK